MGVINSKQSNESCIFKLYSYSWVYLLDMDNGQVSPLIVTVILMVTICFVGGLIYIADDQYKLRMYAKKHPLPTRDYV